MKSVTNSKRWPFHVYKKGHEDGFRSSSVIARGVAIVVSAWRIPDGHSTRITSAPGREPRPNTTSAGPTCGVADEVSMRARRLPARRSIFDPTPARLLARPVRCTAIDGCGCEVELRHQETAPLRSATTRSEVPFAPKSAAATLRGDATTVRLPPAP